MGVGVTGVLLLDIPGIKVKMKELSTRYNQPVVILFHRPPLIWKKLPQPVNRVRHDSAENIIEILPGVHITGLTGFYQGIVQGGSLSTPLTAGK